MAAPTRFKNSFVTRSSISRCASSRPRRTITICHSGRSLSRRPKNENCCARHRGRLHPPPHLLGPRLKCLHVLPNRPQRRLLERMKTFENHGPPCQATRCNSLENQIPVEIPVGRTILAERYDFLVRGAQNRFSMFPGAYQAHLAGLQKSCLVQRLGKVHIHLRVAFIAGVPRALFCQCCVTPIPKLLRPVFASGR